MFSLFQSLIFLALLQGAATAGPAYQSKGSQPPPIRSASARATLAREPKKKEAQFEEGFSEAIGLQRAGQFNAALGRYLEIEHVANGLGEAKPTALQKIMLGEAECLVHLKRLNDAEKIYLRRAEVLRSATDKNALAYAQNFTFLAAPRMLKPDWPGAEQYIEQSIGAYDQMIAQLAGPDVAEARLAAQRSKALDMYYLGLIYNGEGKTRAALDTLEKSFASATELHANPRERAQIAIAARGIAFNSFHLWDAITWQLRWTQLWEEIRAKTRIESATAPAGLPPN